MMTEEFLHYLWRYQRFNLPLATTEGDPVTVISHGQRNPDAGPDYLNARIRIGDTLWAGDVELHVMASDWISHGHQADPGFGSVILHVVHRADCIIQRPDLQELPTVALINQYDPDLLYRYDAFLTAMGWVACEGNLEGMPASLWESWMEHLAEERFQRRSVRLERLFTRNQGHALQSLYEALASGFGQNVNMAPFEWLAQNIPLKIVQRHHEDLTDLEALFFGQAGFLEEKFSETYPLQLQERYRFLSSKYNLEAMPVHVWKFLRMRPSGFPTLKIAQWVAFLHKQAGQLNTLLRLQDGSSLFSRFDQEVSHYWQSHYHFGRKSSALHLKMGKDAILSVVLNGFLPFLFVRGIRSGEKTHLSEIRSIMVGLPAEDNVVVRRWKELGVRCTSALDSQALLELKSQYCDKKNCLHCAIGRALINGAIP